MSEDIFKLIRKIRSGNLNPDQLDKIYTNHQGNYRIKMHLIQCPRFPAVKSLPIITELFTVDLVLIIKNHQTNPFIRKKAENEFILRYQKIPLGEKISILKQVPESLLAMLTFERDPQCLSGFLMNPQCTERVIITFITQSNDKKAFYAVLYNSKWISNRMVISAILKDPQAPIKVYNAIIPLLTKTQLQGLLNAPSIHQSIKKNVEFYLNKTNKIRGFS